MTSSSWRGRLSMRRISAADSRIRRTGLRLPAGGGRRGGSCPGGVFVSWGAAGCPQVAGPLFSVVPYDCQECQGEHRQGDVPVPGVVEADLIVIQAGLVFRGAEAFLHGPSGSRCADQLAEAFMPRV